MRVTRLEIFGFKSFVERFVLNFDQNVIGIVGPNGCGKSNIVDSLRWVLGETHAKQLRGSVQEDLIFNGSDGRRPMGMAEVSITIRPDRDWQKDLPIRLEEMNAERSENAAEATASIEVASIEIKEIEKGGESNDFLRTEAVSIDGPEQANGNTVNGSNGTGVANGNMPAVRVIGSPLLNIPGLLDASEMQLTRRLYRSGESEYFINRVPCRLRDMLDLYRLIGLGARGLSIVQQGTVGQIVTKKPVELRELLEEAAGISGFRTRIEAAQRKLDLTGTNISRLRDIILEVEKQLKVLKRQAKRAENRQELKARLRESELLCFSSKIKRIALRQEHDVIELDGVEKGVISKRNEIEAISVELEALRGDLEISDNTLTNLRRKRDEFGSRIAEVRAIEQRTKLELSEVDGRLRAVINGLQKVDQRKQQIGMEIERRRMKVTSSREQLSVLENDHVAAAETLAIVQKNTTAAFDQLSPEEASIEEEVRRLSIEVDAIGSVSDEIAGIEAEIARLRQELALVERPLHEKRVKFAAAESERGSLEAQLDALAEHVVRAAGATGTDSAESERGRVLLAGLRVPDPIQRAVSAVLGDRAGFLLSDKSSELLRTFSQQTNGADKAKRLGVLSANADIQAAGGSAVRAGVSDRDRELAPSARPIVELIDVDEPFKPIAELFLGSVVFVQSIAEAAALEEQRQPGDGRTFVTATGEVLAPWGWWTTEGKGAQFSFARRIEEQREAARTLSSEIEALAAKSAEISAGIKRGEASQFERREHHRMLVRAQERLSHLMKHRAKEERRRRDDAIAEERLAQSKIRELGQEIARLQGAIDFEEKRTEELKKDLVSLDLESAQLSGEQRQLDAEVVRLKGEVLRPKEEQDRAAELEFNFSHLTEEIKTIDSRRSALAQQMSNRIQENDSRRRDVDRLAQQENSLRLAVEKYRIEASMIEEEITRLYGAGIDLPQLTEEQANSVDQVIQASEQEASRLRNQIEREGEVDPQSIEMAATEQVRFDELTVQHKDLEQATEILGATIKRLKEISRERFISTFEGVSTKYEELVPRLFGGGSGQMTLVNPEDPLSSGVEISVRPPGKKLRSLDLLSGGEKALCATAILMAMFLNHPSPICVLDEVDAPLDDANLERFLDLIREISKTTQFLVITHNKLSMQAVGRLIGITMQESGVSTALTVSLEEISEQVEQWAASA